MLAPRASPWDAACTAAGAGGGIPRVFRGTLAGTVSVPGDPCDTEGVQHRTRSQALSSVPPPRLPPMRGQGTGEVFKRRFAESQPVPVL